MLVRLDDKELKRIDLLVQRQHYKSRNEAIRKMLKSKVSEELSEDEDVRELVEILLKLKKNGKDPLVIKLKKTAVGSVAEGRRRVTSEPQGELDEQSALRSRPARISSVS